MKVRNGFVSNSSSSSFILSKKELTLEQIRGLSSWVNVHNSSSYADGYDHYIRETSNYYFGSVSYHCGLKEQLQGLNISEDRFDLEG